LPVTDVGKVRRSELPRMLGLRQADAEPANGARVAAPASPLEAALVGLWSSVLQVSRVGIDDRFSLLDANPSCRSELLAEIKTVFGIELPAERLSTDAATIAGMARAIEAARSRR
jgi:acyl carrier protein